MQWLMGLGHWGQQIIIPIASIITTVITVLFTIGTIKKRNIDDLTEATTTWHQIADSRKEEIDKKDVIIAAQAAQIAQKDRRIDMLWSMIPDEAREVINARGPTV